MPIVDNDFAGELLGSRELADLASRLYRLGDCIRGCLAGESLKAKPLSGALVFYFARSFKTFQAAVTLVQTGFWQDAAVLARVLREADYQIRWVAAGGDSVAKLFMDDFERNRRRVMATLARLGDPEIKARAQAMVDETEPDQLLDEWWTNWWSKDRKKNIRCLAEQTGYPNAHQLEYPTLSAFVHSPPALVDYYLHTAWGENGVTLETRPGLYSDNQAAAEAVLWTVFDAHLSICRVFASQIGIPCEQALQDIDERIRAALAPN
jgi:hypothetical protein